MLKTLNFGTKAETLQQLESGLRTATVLPQVSFSVTQWAQASHKILRELDSRTWSVKPLIVRSSALHEDASNQSLAGHFLSVQNVVGANQLREAINSVKTSYASSPNPKHQILVQPMLETVKIGGVAFSCDPNTGGPYRVVNYAKGINASHSITGGQSNGMETYYQHISSDTPPPSEIAQIFSLINELESIAKTFALDVEFAFDEKDQLYLLQVRPLASKRLSATAIN